MPIIHRLTVRASVSTASLLSLSTGSITNICILPATPTFPHTRACVCWDYVAWKAYHITCLVVWTRVIPEQANGKVSIIDTRCNLAASLHWPPRSRRSCLWLVSMVKAALFFLLEEVKNLLSLILSSILHSPSLSHSGTVREMRLRPVKRGVVSMQLLGNQLSRENVLELNHMSQRITEDYPQTVNFPSRVNLVFYIFSHWVDLQRSIRKLWDLESSTQQVTCSLWQY